MINKAGARNLDVNNNLKTPDPRSNKHLIDDDDDDFDEGLDDLGGFDDLGEFDDDDED